MALATLALGQDTSRVSVSSIGAQADLDSSPPAISADGRIVAFLSAATSLVSGDTNGIYVTVTPRTQAVAQFV